MRILLVGDYPDDPRLGSAKVPHKLREEFLALGHECKALFENDLGTTALPSRLRWLVAPMLAARSVVRAVRAHGTFDVFDIASAEGLVVGMRKRMGFYRNSALISRSHGLEHLNYARMLEDHDEGLLQKPFHRRVWYPLTRMNQVAGAARLADRLLVINDSDRNHAISKRWKSPDQIQTIPHGISSRFLEGSQAGGTRGRGLLFCGSWTEVKGVHYLAKAFNELVDQGCRVSLTILGGAQPDEHIRSYFSEPAQKFLKLLPRCSEDEVIDNYRKHDVLIFCSTYEGYGMVLIEAMSQGMAVIATPVGAAVSLVQNERTGLMVPRRDPHAIAGAVRRLLEDTALRREIGEGARRAVAHLSWRNTAEKTIALYESARSN